MTGNPTDSAILDPATARWLEHDRRIPVEVATRCGVVTINGYPAFEFRKDGVLQYRKVRVTDPDGGKSFRRDRKSAETCLFLEHAIQEDPDPSSPLVICEGEIDALSCVSVGIPNVVSVPDGAQLDAIGEGKIDPTDDKAFSWLWDGPALKAHVARFKRVVLAIDNDRKGRILREELAVRLERWKCDFVTYPDDCKDANDVLVKHGPSALAKAIAEAKPLVPDQLVPVGDVPDSGLGELFTSGLKGLDEGLNFSFYPPELCIISGTPGAGKSELAVVMGAHLASIHKLPGAILQFEDKTKRVQETLIRYALNHNVDGVGNRGEAVTWINRWFRTIVPEQNLADDVDYDFAWLKATMREARERHGCRWVILDPWNELDHMWDRSMNEAQYTNDALRKLKRISRALGLIVMVVVHPSKEGGRQTDITEKDLYGVSGSASWANKADHGIIVHRPDQSKAEVYVKVAKSKDHSVMGKVGICCMEYVPSQSRYRFIRMGV